MQMLTREFLRQLQVLLPADAALVPARMVEDKQRVFNFIQRFEQRRYIRRWWRLLKRLEIAAYATASPPECTFARPLSRNSGNSVSAALIETGKLTHSLARGTRGQVMYAEVEERRPIRDGPFDRNRKVPALIERAFTSAPCSTSSFTLSRLPVPQMRAVPPAPFEALGRPRVREAPAYKPFRTYREPHTSAASNLPSLGH
jgi:hypothetical protein